MSAYTYVSAQTLPSACPTHKLRPKKKIDNELTGTQRQQVDAPNRFPICTACEL